nr:glycosyltransferase family 4 protein [Motiliproteus sp. SC1-56]
MRVALILKGYPRLSETFIAQEIRKLEQRGLQLTLVSLRHPTDKAVHPIHREIEAPVLYLPEYLHQEPLRVLAGLLASLRRPSALLRALAPWLRDLVRDPSRNRLRRFGQALVLAAELPPGTDWLYAHFIHTPGSVTRYCARLTGLPWSASAHAKDIWTLPAWELREKLAELQWLVTCTQANCDYLQRLSPVPGRVSLVYHGLDFQRFSPALRDEHSHRNGLKAPVELISVGRAVPKKGYRHLLNALAQLPGHLHWRLTHIGGGTELPRLQRQAQALGVDERVRWLGALPQEEVLDYYRQADIFVLASTVVDDGDRDGLPNVLMEAQSQRLCCISTRISGIPELIHDGETGLLVEERDEDALAAALTRLIADPALRHRLGEAGYHRVTEQFDADRGIDILMEKFPAASP